MENAKIKVLRFNSEDVIATSGLCSRDGGALQLYAFGEHGANWCGWFIGEDYFYETDDEFKVFGDWNKCKDIFDNGEKSDIDDCNDIVATNEWYHYEDGTYYLCNNTAHQ